jgi:protein-S-isoprenylcysteine O-methyltransferase Ste14
MSPIDEVSRNFGEWWLVSAMICAEAIIGLIALRNSRRECQVQAVRSPQTAAAVLTCFVLHSVVTAVASWFSMWPLPVFSQWAMIAGVLVGAAGLSFAAAGFWEFHSLQRMSGLATDRLVTSGIYRFSRNPQNLGWGLMLLGIAIAGRSGLACVLALIYWAVFRHYVATEERHLAWIFSTKWERYLSQTPRFFSLAPLWRGARQGRRAYSKPSSPGRRVGTFTAGEPRPARSGDS